MAKISKEEKINTISFKLPHNLVEELTRIAKKEDRSRSAVARRFLQEKVEDYLDLQDGLKALEEIKNNPNRKVYSSEEIKKRLSITKEDLNSSKYDFSDCD